MHDGTIGAAEPQPPTLSIVNPDARPAPIGAPGLPYWPGFASPNTIQPYGRMVTPVKGEPGLTGLASTIHTYLDAIQGDHPGGVGYGTLALCADIGVSDDRWQDACAEIEAAGMLERFSLGRLTIHRVINPARADDGTHWTRVPLGVLREAARLGGPGPESARLWARLANWQGNGGWTRQLLTELGRTVGVSAKTAGRITLGLRNSGWLHIDKQEGRWGHIYRVVDPSKGSTAAELHKARVKMANEAERQTIEANAALALPTTYRVSDRVLSASGPQAVPVVSASSPTYVDPVPLSPHPIPPGGGCVDPGADAPSGIAKATAPTTAGGSRTAGTSRRAVPQRGRPQQPTAADAREWVAGINDTLALDVSGWMPRDGHAVEAGFDFAVPSAVADQAEHILGIYLDLWREHQKGADLTTGEIDFLRGSLRRVFEEPVANRSARWTLQNAELAAGECPEAGYQNIYEQMTYEDRAARRGRLKQHRSETNLARGGVQSTRHTGSYTTADVPDRV